MNSDSELLKGCLEGRKEIQKQLYQKYASTMLGICLRYFQTREEAEDALQEGFIRVFTNLVRFRNEGSLEGWIKRIMVNTSLNLVRNQMKHQFHMDIEDAESDLSEEEEITGNISRDEMLRLLQELPNGYRMVFNLYEIEGYSHKEIAEALSVTVSTSKTQLLKARKLLQKKLNNLNRIAVTAPDQKNNEDE
jgi:RNA polymerase sigma-70 factor (ECF subfamily)